LIRERKYRRVPADAQRERQYRDHCEPRIFRERPDSVAQILE
jgi:hypothetical protein